MLMKNIIKVIVSFLLGCILIYSGYWSMIYYLVDSVEMGKYFIIFAISFNVLLIFSKELDFRS